MNLIRLGPILLQVGEVPIWQRLHQTGSKRTVANTESMAAPGIGASWGKDEGLPH